MRVFRTDRSGDITPPVGRARSLELRSAQKGRGASYEPGMPHAAEALLWGEDPFLLRSAAQPRLEGRGLRATEVDGSEWQGGETSDLATPSLWGERRALLITECQALPEQGGRELRAYVGAPVPDALCVLTQVTRGKNPPAVAKVLPGGGRDGPAGGPASAGAPQWVLGPGPKGRGSRSARPPPRAHGHVGPETAGWTRRSNSSRRRSTVDRGPEEVRSQFRGMGEKQVWDLCDQAFTGRLPRRWSRPGTPEGRSDPLIILGGVAARIRDLIRVRASPTAWLPAEAARAAGLRFDWQLRRYREQAGRMHVEELAELRSWSWKPTGR